MSSIRLCADAGTRASKRATFAAENSSRAAAHKLCRPAPDDQGGEDERESDVYVRCAICIRGSSFFRSSEERDIPFSLRDRSVKRRSFVADARDDVRFSRR